MGILTCLRGTTHPNPYLNCASLISDTFCISTCFDTCKHVYLYLPEEHARAGIRQVTKSKIVACHNYFINLFNFFSKDHVDHYAIPNDKFFSGDLIMMLPLFQQLTGGVLLSRNKEFIVFYRGKDFLPSAVSTAIEERRNSEIARQKHNSYNSLTEAIAATSSVGGARPKFVDELPEATKEIRSITSKSELRPPTLAIKSLETKLLQVCLDLSLEERIKFSTNFFSYAYANMFSINLLSFSVAGLGKEGKGRETFSRIGEIS